ncbi:MAG TPA: TlyA family RNA methyltransferase [Bacillota bacterium]|jgi:23S rRNA (cytidine1920-2'-O)/16S rRNA (cytidine1409-2'-O)-methyltransferase|nr:TlyA family RNA methyltransferase [Bacillota bacterium]
MNRRRFRRVRLDELLVQRGFFDDVKTAQGWIMAGSVIVDEVREDKPGTMVDANAGVRVRGTDLPYASRGGLKLAAALDAFGVDVRGRTAIDAGASTGGFTDCLLEHGAALVYSVDVGFGQLVGRLRQDPRVRNMERTNISDVTPGMLDPRPSLGVIDLSYLSLQLSVPIVANLLDPEEESEIVALVKPLFEVASAVSDLTREQYRAAVWRALSAGTPAGMAPRAVMASPVLGSRGTLEFLVWYTAGRGLMRDVASAQVDEAIGAGMDILSKAQG